MCVMFLEIDINVTGSLYLLFQVVGILFHSLIIFVSFFLVSFSLCFFCFVFLSPAFLLDIYFARQTLHLTNYQIYHTNSKPKANPVHSHGESQLQQLLSE